MDNLEKLSVTTREEVEEFMAQLAHANINVPFNLSLNLNKEEIESLILPFFVCSKPSIKSVNNILTQYGTINVNLIEE